MKRFFRTKVPALLLALVLTLGAVPVASAATITWDNKNNPSCPHSSYTVTGYSDPDCTRSGFRLLKCSLCGTSGVEVLPATGHTFSRYGYDNTYHWLVCSKCGTADSTKELHRDDNRDGWCDVCSASVNLNVTSDDEITYTVRPGSSVRFDEDDFYDLFRSFYPGYRLDYVVFDQPRSSAFDQGALYYDYGGGTSQILLTRTSLSTYTFYYDASSRYLSLDKLTFVAGNSFSNDVTLSFRAYYDNYRYVDASVTISSTGGSAVSQREISYTVRPGSYVDLDEDDFNSAFRSVYPGYSLQYVIFDQPSSSVFSNGALYYGYNTSSQLLLTRTSLSSYTFAYRGAGAFDLDRLTFVAGSNFTDKVTLSFRAYDSSGRYVNGSVTISSTSSGTQGDITYQVQSSSRVDLDEDDFYDLYRKSYSSDTLQYVIFDRPSTTAFSNGTLYYDYGGGSSQITLTRSNLEDYVFYYKPSSAARYDLDWLTFVTDRSFSGTVTLSFRAYGTGGRYVDGTVSFTTSAVGGDIAYTVRPGGYVNLDEDDFYDLFRKSYSGSSLQYVIFDRPSTTAFNDGTLYYNYGGGSSQVTLTRSNLSDYTFYYNPSSAARYDLDWLTFVADSDFRDKVTLSFRAYDNTGRYVDGTVTLSPDGTAGTAASLTGDIRYAGTYNNKIQINANDIARYFNKSYPGATLQYVTLGGVPSTGSLYYNYYGASRYGSSTSLRLTSANYNSQVLYFSPMTTAQYALTELTYVPSGYNYCDVIPFTAYGTGAQSVSGSILISVNSAAVSEVYGVTQRNTAVTFPASAISSVVSSATGVSLSGIQLLKLPTASQGVVYLGTGSTRAALNTLYTTQQISQLRFVPNASFTGSVEIPYAAYNGNGTAIATGLFSLGVLSGSRTFRDVSSSTWCYKYVVELSDANVIDGYADGSFKPDSTVTYGAALKLIMLAAGYPEQSPVNSNVFSGYLAKAKADGIITRSDVDLTKPITRLQVAQIAAGAMKLNTSNLSSVQPFTDTTDASVRALNAAGIVEGYFSNGTSTYLPNNTLTRGQLSAIVWRMEQYGK